MFVCVCVLLLQFSLLLLLLHSFKLGCLLSCFVLFSYLLLLILEYFLFYTFCRVSVSCSKLALEKPSSLRQALIRYISEAMEHAPSIIIFDDLDSIIASSSESDGSQPSSSSTALVQFFADIMDEYEVKINCVCVACVLQ